MDDPRYAATREAWSAIWRAADIQRELGTRDYRRSRETRERFVPFLPVDAPILEAGCGLGVELIGLAAQGYRVVGLDYVCEALVRLGTFQPGLLLVAGDVHALPFREGAFGAYLSFGVLEHFAFGPGPGLREAHRVLRANGILVVTVPSPSLVWRLARARRRWQRPPQEEPFGYFETTYSAAELQRAVVEAGFEVVTRHPIGHSFTLWGFGRPFRGTGYYETSAIAEWMGRLASKVMPWSLAFATLIVARKTGRP